MTINLKNGEILEGKKKGKYLKCPITKDGNSFYLFVEYGDDGNIKQIFEKPNFKEIEEAIHTSGCHIIVDFPQRDHYDHYKDGKKWEEKKTNKMPYWACGSIVGIED